MHETAHNHMAATSTATPALTALIVLIAAAAWVNHAVAYTNHTVGGDAGWLFDPADNSTAANYSSWAASETFTLGDYLIFKTNSNQTVIQTYNETNYNNCSVDDDETGGDTFQYGGGVQDFGQLLDIAVPLTIEEVNYFFSDADDGSQCQHGMAFTVKVQHGSGLPPSLSQPPPPPYVEPPESTPAAATVPTGGGGLRSGGGGVGKLALALLFCFLLAFL